MKILELRAENFKKLRVVEIRPDGNLIAITGRNGQGKTSVLDSIWFALKGKKAMPMKPVRKGTERLKVSLETEDFTITRTLGRDSSTPNITLEMKKGKNRDATPQEFLDNIIGELTFDPLEFLRMAPKEQVAALRKTAKIEVDFDKLDEDNLTDYKARKLINADVQQLDGQIKGMNVLADLPKDKLDEAAIMTKLNAASQTNNEALAVSRKRSDLGAEAARIGSRKTEVIRRIEALERNLDEVKAALAGSKKQLMEIDKDHAAAEKAYKDAPEGVTVDIAALTQELASAQRTNRAIDTRTQWEELRKSREAKQRESEKLTRQMEAREEEKRAAIASAAIPVDGLTFDETQVLFNGLPLENLGEGEQIRLSTKIGMAANPKLRVLCIRHGEALDEDGLKVIAKLAEEHDFQVWMARVDTTGKVGIVLEDGMVLAHEEV